MRTLQFFIDKLDKRYDLSYVDYRDSLDENLNLVQEAIRDGNMDKIYDEASTWYHEQEWDSANEYASQCLSQNDATDEEVEEHTDNLRDEVFNRNEGNPVKDLLKNTSDQFMYYECGFYVEEQPWSLSQKDFESYCKKIAKYAKIDYQENKKAIKELLANASYGGTLVYFWVDNPEPYINDKIKHIEFKDGCLALIDRYYGSGYDIQVKGTARYKYDSTIIYLDDCAGGYSYGRDVCGLIKSYYTKYNPKLIIGRKPRPTPESRFRENSEYITCGNVITDTQYGAYIRPYDEIGTWVGATKEKGHLRTWDIEHFPCKIPTTVLDAIKKHPEQLILTNFHVNIGKSEKKHIGWILMNDKHEIVYEKAEDYNDFGWAKEKLLASIAKYK